MTEDVAKRFRLCDLAYLRYITNDDGHGFQRFTSRCLELVIPVASGELSLAIRCHICYGSLYTCCCHASVARGWKGTMATILCSRVHVSTLWSLLIEQGNSFGADRHLLPFYAGRRLSDCCLDPLSATSVMKCVVSPRTGTERQHYHMMGLFGLLAIIGKQTLPIGNR